MNKNNIFYHEQLLKRRLSFIANNRFSVIVEPTMVEVTECFKTEAIDNAPDAEQYKSISLPYNYGGIDDYMWTKVTYSGLDKEIEYTGIFDLGVGSPGLTCGAESLLYLNGEPHAGVDLNHREILLGKLQDEQQLLFRTWSGIADETRLEEMNYIQGFRNHGEFHTISSLKIGVIDNKVNNLYYNLKALLEAYDVLKDTDITSSTRIINDLSKVMLSCDEADLNTTMLHELDEGVELILSSYPKDSLAQMYAVGQTHIDLAWLWRVKHTREKAARSFSTMLNLMDRNQEYTFLQSQPQLLQYLKEDYPTIYARMQEAANRGQLEVDGAMWLEADCNIPSGESLTRQVLYGKQFIKNEFNSDSKMLWMPDVFGYSWAMPQILKKSGVNMFCTTKMQWNQVNRMPFNSFKWKGIDGTEISTHLIEDFSFFTINAKSMVSGWEKYKDKDLTNSVLYQYGFGDGGGGPRQEDIELVKRFDKIPGLPNIKYKRSSEYFKELDNALNTSESYVHVWDGEMYLELHRGTYTSQARMKKLNRKLEFALRELEMISSYVFLLGNDIEGINDRIKTVWKLVLLNQFHDIIPGSSINEVYKDAEKVYAQCFKQIEQIELDLLSVFEEAEGCFYVYNAYHKNLDRLILFESEEHLQFTVNDQVLSSVYENGVYKIIIPNLAALTFTKIKYSKVETKLENIEPKQQLCFETRFYKIGLNSVGQIVRLYDKELERELVQAGKVFNKLVSYEDKPLAWDAWDIDIFYDKRERVVDECLGYKVVCSNELETIIEFEYKHFESTIKQQIILSDLTKRIDIKHDVDYQNSHRLLRVLFETDIRAVNARYDIQYGNALRPTHSNTSWDMQKFEMLGHKWADLSNNSYGISILNDCKYGYSISGSTIGLSLIKAGTFPDKTQDIGNHKYTYSIYPHIGDVLDSDIEVEAFCLNTELKIYNKHLPQLAPLTIENTNIVIDAMKISEDESSVILRVHETQNKVSQLQTNFDYEETNLLEQTVEKSELCAYDLKTLRLNKLWF